jgi:hypothetical protein
MKTVQNILISKGKNGNRNLSLDILKIISMAMVVVWHMNMYGMDMEKVSFFSGVYVLCNINKSFCVVAVNCFFLCTGYFLSTKKIQYNRLISLWVQVITYSTVIYVVLSIFTEVESVFNLKDFIKQCLPLLTNQYWFFTCYFLLYMLMPILNKYIQYTEKKEYSKCLIILLVVLSIVDNLNIFGNSFSMKQGYSLIWFLVLYLVAGYIRKYPLKYEAKTYGILYILISFLIFFVKVFIDVFKDKLSFIYTDNRLYAYNSPVVFGAAVCCFLFFVNLKMNFKNKKIEKLIMTVSTLSFGVYLLHEHNIMREVLWEAIDFTRMENSAIAYLIGLIVIVIGIFIVGILVEKIRKEINLGISKVVKFGLSKF